MTSLLGRGWPSPCAVSVQRTAEHSLLGGETEQMDISRISYDPETGIFRWAVSEPGVSAGKVAGSLTKYGYWVVKLERKQYRAHRLAWFIAHGVWPIGEVDHINGDRLDNRLANLRVVDRAGNSQNQLRAHRDNRSCGLLGVTWNKQHGKWQAKLQARKKRHHVGYFSNPEAAHAAYLEAKAVMHIGVGSH